MCRSFHRSLRFSLHFSCLTGAMGELTRLSATGCAVRNWIPWIDYRKRWTMLNWISCIDVYRTFFPSCWLWKTHKQVALAPQWPELCFMLLQQLLDQIRSLDILDKYVMWCHMNTSKTSESADDMSQYSCISFRFELNMLIASSCKQASGHGASVLERHQL